MAIALQRLEEAALEESTKARYRYAMRMFWRFLRVELCLSAKELRAYTGPEGPKAMLLTPSAYRALLGNERIVGLFIAYMLKRDHAHSTAKTNLNALRCRRAPTPVKAK